MRDLSKTRLAKQTRSERDRSERTITVEEGRHMVRQSDDDERAKAERLPRKGLENA
jgi:hypothetical protein